jgi:glutaryl-CoA dehydrogenase (non-decarboxylating)
MDAMELQADRRTEFRRFTLEHVCPYAQFHDRTQEIASHIIPALARHDYLAPFLPVRWGGNGMDMVTYGMLHEEMGRACSSVRSLLTVHDMVCFSILRWGNDELRQKWLPRLSRGELTAALGISEPNAGSDLNGVQTVARQDGDAFILTGKKKWITFGQIAGVFLVLAKGAGGPTTFLVERDTPGLTIEPISAMLGTRGSMLALLTFADCRVSRTNLLGRPGFGANPVALAALGLGRYSVACGSLGIAQACLDASYDYASTTRRFGGALKSHQLIQQMITQMITDTTASRLLCRLAGDLKDQKDPREIMQTFIAKYFASTAAMRAADSAVQIHGANGCSQEYPVERLMRDAKVMEIIEGSTQIQQITIAELGFQDFERQRLDAENDCADAAVCNANEGEK